MTESLIAAEAALSLLVVAGYLLVAGSGVWTWRLVAVLSPHSARQNRRVMVRHLSAVLAWRRRAGVTASAAWGVAWWAVFLSTALAAANAALNLHSLATTVRRDEAGVVWLAWRVSHVLTIGGWLAMHAAVAALARQAWQARQKRKEP